MGLQKEPEEGTGVPQAPRESPGAAGMETYELEDALDHDEGQGLQGHHPGCRSRRRLPRRGSRSSPLREEDGGQDRAQGHAARCPRSRGAARQRPEPGTAAPLGSAPLGSAGGHGGREAG